MWEPGMRMKVAVQDRQRLFRDGLAWVLAAEPDLEVVAAVATAAELAALTADPGFELDVVLLELDSDDWDACRLTAALRAAHPKLAVIGTWAEESAQPSPRAHQAGVRAIFPRRAGIRTLLQTIRSLPAHAPVQLPRPARLADERRPLLTAREVELLGAIGSGATTAGAALALGISPKTVENHKQRIFSKLGVQNQAHAVAVALRQGLIAPVMARTGTLG